MDITEFGKKLWTDSINSGEGPNQNFVTIVKIRPQ